MKNKLIKFEIPAAAMLCHALYSASWVLFFYMWGYLHYEFMDQEIFQYYRVLMVIGEFCIAIGLFQNRHMAVYFAFGISIIFLIELVIRNMHGSTSFFNLPTFIIYSYIYLVSLLYIFKDKKMK